MGRPRLDISEERFRELAQRQCTQEEIAAELNCSVDTLTRRFADIFQKEKLKGRVKLRETQYETAINGNVTMQIWLGKQYLEQSDKQDVLTTFEPIVIETTRAVFEITSTKDVAKTLSPGNISANPPEKTS